MAERDSIVVDWRNNILESWSREFKLSYSVWRMLNAQTTITELLKCSQAFEKTLFEGSAESELTLRDDLIANLAPNTLNLLVQATPEIFPTLMDANRFESFSEAVSNARSAEGKGRLRKNAIADLAAIAIHTNLSAYEYWVLAKKLLRRKWSPLLFDRGAIDAFESCLSAIRSDANPSEKIHAPDEFGEFLLQENLLDVWDDWAEIGRRIISSFHTWPIVVMDSSAKNAGFAVPLLLDVHYDHKARTGCVGAKNLARFDWGAALQRAREVAVFFWGNQHNRLTNHKARILECSMFLDVTPTTDVIRHISSHNADLDQAESAELLGRSLEGCLVIAMMNRFLGNRSSPNYAVCGQIGGDPTTNNPNNDDTEGLDPTNWSFEPVQGFEEKLIWAAEASDFHTAIVPKGCSQHIESSGIEVEEHGNLLQVVDAVFGVDWRREKYIGCSDFAFARNRVVFGEISGTRLGDDVANRELIAKKWLAEQQERISIAPESISGFDIMLALHAFNELERTNSIAALFPKRSFTIISMRELGIVNAATLIAQSCGARPQQIDKLLLSSDDLLAKSAFAKIVGNVDGGYGPRSQPFPDVLVLLAEPQEVGELFSRNPLILDKLLNQNCAKKIDSETANRKYDKAVNAWEQVAGRSRIILAKPGVPIRLFPKFSPPEGQDDIWKLITQLSIVGPEIDTRTLFGLLDAAGLKRNEFDESIKQLQRNGFLLKSFAGYFVNPKFETSQSLAENWSAHDVAACAVVPMLGMNAGSHVHGQARYSAYATSLAMKHLHKAIWLLKQGVILGRIQQNIARPEIQRLDRQASFLTMLQHKEWTVMEKIYRNRGQFGVRDVVSYALLGAQWCVDYPMPDPSRLTGLLGVIVFACSQAERSNLDDLLQSMRTLEECAVQIMRHCKRAEGENPVADIMYWSRMREVVHSCNLAHDVRDSFEQCIPNDHDILQQILSEPKVEDLRVDRAWATRMYTANTSTEKTRSALRKIFPRIRTFWTDLSFAKGSHVKDFLYRDLIWSKSYHQGQRRVARAFMFEIIEDQCTDDAAKRKMKRIVA